MKNITYRPPQLSDVDQLLEHINTLSKEETYIRKQGSQLTKEEEIEYLSGFIKDIEEGKAVKILVFDEDVLVGGADVKAGFGAEKHVGIFGIVISKEYRDQGIGTELMKRTLEEAKKNIKNLEIITLGVFSDNKRAINLYKKFGFSEYGTLPNGVIRKGEYYDHINMYLDVSGK
jgi:RimJ/RimL family protein N-acetyltransferase